MLEKEGKMDKMNQVLYFPLALCDRAIEFCKLFVIVYAIETADQIIGKTLFTIEHTITKVDNTASTASDTLKAGLFAGVLSKIFTFV